MLRSMVFQNFVHFEERFHLDFSTNRNKPFFFIGSSSTGKTAVLELIRRCLSSRINSSLTNRSDDSKLAFVFCEFELRKENTPSKYDGYGPKVITGLIIAGKDNTDENKTKSYKDENEMKSDEDENKTKSDKDENETKSDNTDEKDTSGKDENKTKSDKDENKTTTDKDENETKSDNTDENMMKSDSTDENMMKSDNTDENETQTKKNIEGMGGEKEQEPKDESKSEKPEFYKIIMYTDMTENGKFRVVCETFNRQNKNHDDDSNKNINLSFDGPIAKMSETNSIHETEVKEILDLISQNNTEADKNHQELWDYISESYVGILPNRGLGLQQWFSSTFVREISKVENYQAACERAEIINQLLGKEPKNSEVFQFLTRPDTFEFFKKDDGNIEVRQMNSERKYLNPFPLLKTPIGILEAKEFSLVIEYDKFQTITFEEPDRGMHPQMIERLREMLYKKCVDKTVIIVTHCPSLIDYLAMNNTFIFYKKKHSAKILHGLTHFDEENIKEASDICGKENLKRIFFSSKVLLVEGRKDKLVLEAIFRSILNNPSPCDDAIKVENILSHQIIVAGGCQEVEKVQNFCKKINLPCKAVLDRDVYLEVDGEGQIEGVNKLKGFDNFREQPIQEFLKDGNGFEKLSQKLKNEGIFIWKNGDLEDFLISKKSDRDYRVELCEFLNIDKYDPTWRRKGFKQKIKVNLNEKITRENFEKLAEKLLKFDETKRLLSFLNA